MGGLAILLGAALAASVYYNKNLLLTVLIMLSSGLVGLLDDLLGLRSRSAESST